MFELLSNLVSDTTGPERRKVKQYLDATTRDTVYADLAKLLSWQLKRPQFLQETFDQYCVEDPLSHEKCWTAESFHSHIRSAPSAGAISDAAIALLWRSFHFYAYHPFTRDSQQHANVKFDAFNRAALFTVYQCDSLLGTRELDWYWRESSAFFRKAGFTRIFRSIAVPENEFPEQQQEMDITSSALSDAMDVLVMIGPQFIHSVPSESQLGSVARRLFADGPAVSQRNVVMRKDILVLMDLLLRLRLQEERWAGSYHFGTVVEAESARGDLTEAIVDCLTGRCNEQYVTIQQLSKQMDLMPHFLLRFQQLWAVLFQPTGAADVSKLTVDKAGLTSIGGAISLFAPHIIVDHAGRQRSDEQDTRLTLEVAQISPDSRDTTLRRLRQSISDDSTAHIVLFTTTADINTPKTIIGAYLPSPSTTEVTNAHLPIKLETPHIIFQLQPSFRLLQWAKRQMSRADLITSGGEVSADVIVPEGDSELPYRIGDPLGQGVGLRVDSRKRAVTFMKTVGTCYVEMPVGGEDDFEDSWDVTVQNAHMNIFTLPSVENNNNR
ncbi:hypothetical protein GQX73_g5761 [Xylaria multiplex]|uniref:Uncharacterized protein n=1 Tax=Xylaria multiplex TaxID=323545 RepID=A0A7C8MLA5_9PEZI|nr:hypothetical protein GQX73_g5761 [Xylaria multiplex]